MNPPRTGIAGPLKGALSVAWHSQLHDSRAAMHDIAEASPMDEDRSSAWTL